MAIDPILKYAFIMGMHFGTKSFVGIHEVRRLKLFNENLTVY